MSITYVIYYFINNWLSSEISEDIYTKRIHETYDRPIKLLQHIINLDSLQFRMQYC